MNLSHPWMLHFLWLVPLTALLFIVAARRKTRAQNQVAEPPLMERLTDRVERGRRGLRSAFLLAAIVFMVLALAGPRWGSHLQEVVQKGVDIVIALDVSRSMLVEDVEPNRLERAKREISDLIRVIQGDRVGLAAFAGAAFTQCPLTLDYGALHMFLSALGPDVAPVPGTDLGAAIRTAAASFDHAAETDKVILLITDGEDHENRGLGAAREAAGKGIKIFVFGIGDPSGGPIPSDGNNGGFQKDREGQLVLSTLNEEGLREIASAAGGTYVRSVAGDLDLDLLYFDGIKQRTEAMDLKSGKIRVYEERFPLFVLAALFFLLMEGLIREVGRRPVEVRKAERGTRNTYKKRKSLMVLFALAGIFFRSAAQGAAEADALYEEGRFAEAEKIYAQEDMDHPRDLRYRYNRGCAGYQGGDYQGAMAAFSSVLKRADDRETRFRAAYNLGNAAFKLGDAASAAEYYRQALRILPEQEDTRHNLEVALRQLEAQQQEKKKKPEEAPQNGGEKGPSEQRGQKEKPQDKASSEGPSGKDHEAKKEPDRKKEKTAPDPGKRDPEEGTEDGPSGDEKKDTGPPEDLSGDLKPREALPDRPADRGERDPVAASSLDQMKAEALLDNVTEDRSRFLRLQLPEGMRQGASSGKDW